jgi:hypothetical protein
MVRESLHDAKIKHPDGGFRSQYVDKPKPTPVIKVDTVAVKISDKSAKKAVKKAIKKKK